MFQVFCHFDRAEAATRRAAAADFYSLLEQLRAAVRGTTVAWADYPTLVDYVRICFWAIRKLEYSFAAEALAHIESQRRHESLRVLDIGCGVVPFCNWASRRGHTVTAIDPLASDIEFLRQSDLNAFYGSNVDYRVGRSEQLEFANETFDVVSCISVLEHIAPGNDRLALWEAARVLKPGGSLILSFDVSPPPRPEPGQQPWSADHRRYAYPFSPPAAARLFESISNAFEVSASNVPDELPHLTWDEVHAFWRAGEEHDERDDPVREYVAMGGVLRRRDQLRPVAPEAVSAAFLEGQDALAERVAFFSSHAQERMALVQRLDEVGQVLREEVEEKEQAIDLLSSVAEERGHVIETLHSVAAERLVIIEELHGTVGPHSFDERSGSGLALAEGTSTGESADFEQQAALADQEDALVQSPDESSPTVNYPALVELVMRQSHMLDRIEARLDHTTLSYERARHLAELEFKHRLEIAERLRIEAEAAAAARLAVIEEQERALRHFRFWSFEEQLRRLRSPKLGTLYQHPPSRLNIPHRYFRLPRLTHQPLVVSIVTPSLNQGSFIERTIKSVLDQAYPQLEYVVQDAVSSDDTPQVLEQYATRLAHVDSRPDTGFANGINIGFAHTTGEIMAYLNSDDLLLPGTLHYVSAYFATHPDVDVVYGHRVIIDEYDAEIGRWVLPRHQDDVLSWADFVPQETLFWRRSIWDKVGGAIDESFRFAIDWDLLIRFRDAGGRMHRLPRFLGAFRVHPHQKTSSSLTDLGAREMNQLRYRSLGRHVTQTEVNEALGRYLRLHILYDKLYRLGVLRY